MKQITIVLLTITVAILARAAVYQYVFDKAVQRYQRDVDQNELDNIEFMKLLKRTS